MRKILSIVATSVAVLMLSSGCSSSSSNGLEMSAHPDGDKSICKTAIFVGDKNSEEIIHAIKIAGKEHGWRMTPFKSNAIIAEKEIDGKTVSTTISFKKEHISCSLDGVAEKDLKTLREAIVEEIKRERLNH
ncbi:MAG: hypothetical protein WCY51_01045 [Sulfurimonas sp.]|uniref:hypothetical protein n=1 Tax=Sulfurimonas sp. TaxID=2022749 RepID=UPI0025E8DCCC|nr:hypothetical protein [Sulfurimonas sp.]MCK9454972.1 hypothetical protein [Sulfurimonas sp.]